MTLSYSSRDLFLLGSTGSIGTQTLAVVAAHREQFRIRGLAAGGSHLELLAKQVKQFRPGVVAISDETKVSSFARLLKSCLEDSAGMDRYPLAGEGASSTPGGDYFPELISGPDSAAELCERASSEAVVMNGITGGVGLKPTLAALKRGATLALANKESLVVGGALVKKAMVRPAQIVPVDSEHSAIAQCLRSGVHHRGLCTPNLDGDSQVHQLVLTASGGPFRGLKRRDLVDVTPKQALDHPTWNMGPVVTINSSTLVNKGLELIEAHLLFDLPPEKIHPVIHPQSLIHSMVTWRDGATIAQVSDPDMKLPIALGLSWEQRFSDVCKPLDWSKAQDWHFEPVDHDTFPALKLAAWAVNASDTHPAVYNAANEVLVDRFCQNQLPYLGIVDCLSEVLQFYPGSNNPDLAQIEEVENWARNKALEVAKGQA